MGWAETGDDNVGRRWRQSSRTNKPRDLNPRDDGPACVYVYVAGGAILPYLGRWNARKMCGDTIMWVYLSAHLFPP